MSMISSAATWSCDPESPPESKYRKDDTTTCQIFEAGGALQTNKQRERRFKPLMGEASLQQEVWEYPSGGGEGGGGGAQE